MKKTAAAYYYSLTNCLRPINWWNYICIGYTVWRCQSTRYHPKNGARPIGFVGVRIHLEPLCQWDFSCNGFGKQHTIHATHLGLISAVLTMLMPNGVFAFREDEVRRNDCPKISEKRYKVDIYWKIKRKKERKEGGISAVRTHKTVEHTLLYTEGKSESTEVFDQEWCRVRKMPCDVERRAEHQANLVCVFEGAAMWRMVARHWVGGGAYSHQRKQFALRDRHGQQEKMSRLVWEWGETKINIRFSVCWVFISGERLKRKEGVGVWGGTFGVHLILQDGLAQRNLAFSIC